MNRLKLQQPLLQGEGHLRAPRGLGGDVLVLERARRRRRRARGVDPRQHDGGARRPSSWPAAATASRPQAATGCFRVCRDDAPEAGEPVAGDAPLDARRSAYLLPEARTGAESE